MIYLGVFNDGLYRVNANLGEIVWSRKSSRSILELIATPEYIFANLKDRVSVISRETDATVAEIDRHNYNPSRSIATENNILFINIAGARIVAFALS